MAKKLIRLTESDLHRIVKESVRKILKEDDGSYKGVFIHGNKPDEWWIPKIDACFKKGWSVEEIQQALDDNVREMEGIENSLTR